MKELIEKKKVEFNRLRSGYNETDEKIWNFISVSLQEAYKKAIADCTGICDVELKKLNKFNYAKDKPAITSVKFARYNIQLLSEVLA